MMPVRAAIAGLSAASRTDPGRVRSNNEDLPLCDPQAGVYAVIDGVGGQAAGEVAASIARKVILERLARPLGTASARVREAIALANNEIFKEADASAAYHGMTCVLTLALVTDRRLTVGHVGDSRLYKLRGNGLRKLTHDHSPIGEREDAREISETAAMQHPRRNEVFRDVGSANRDKDDERFVEVIEDTVETDCAILLCTDGLSDMVPSSTIEHVVRQHAGDAQAVVDALISTANEAGGKDNITVVYAEGPDFARAFRGDPSPASEAPSPETRSVQGFARRLVPTGRTTWFALGSVAGVIAVVLALVLRLGDAAGGRIMIVGGAAPQAFSSIAAAMATARPGDVIQLEPGTYEEQVVIADGVDLVARLAGSAVLTRGVVDSPPWTAITSAGNAGGRIYGIRIVSTGDKPVEVGMRLSGQGHTIELADISGPMKAGVELVAASGITIRGSLLQVGRGPAITLDDSSEVTLGSNTFVRAGASVEPALSVGPASRVAMARNVFVGYGVDILRGLSADERRQMLADNVTLPHDAIAK